MLLSSTVASFAATITWDGGANTGAWGTGTNWSNNSVPANGDDLVFNAAGANGQFTISLGGNRTTLGMTFSNTGTSGFTFTDGSARTLTLNGGGLTNNNSNTQTFGSNITVTVNATQTWNAASGGFTFNGPVNINNALTLSGSGNFSFGGTTGLSANLTNSNSGSVTFSGTTNLLANVTLAGSGSTNFSGTLVNNNGNRTFTNNSTGTTTINAVNLSQNATSRTLTFAGTGTTQVTGTVANGGGSSAGNIIKSGTGTLVLSGNNTYAGTTTLSQGTLVLGNNNALGSGSSAVTVNDGSTGTNATSLLIGANNVTIGRSITVANSGSGVTTLGGNIASGSGTFSGAVTLNRSVNLSADGTSNISFTGNIGGTGGVTKVGAGTVTLSGTNNFAGGSTLNAGTLALGSNSALGTGALTINGGTLSASGGARSITNSVTANSDFAIGGSQDLTLSGAFNLGAGNRTITVDNSGTTTFSGVVSQSYTANLIKAGAGRLVLSNANTLTGPTIVSAGTLAITNNNALGVSDTWNNVVSNGATLELSNNITATLGGITITGSGVGGVGALNNLSGNNTLNGQVALGGAATINATAGTLTFGNYIDLLGFTLTTAGAGDITFSGQIGNSGSLNKTGSGTLTLSGPNSYSGGTTIAQGTLVANNSVALGTSGTVRFTGGTLRYGSGITTDYSSRIANSTGAIAIDTNGNNVTFASSLAGTNTGGFTKSGTGTLTLMAANSYTGGTTVNAGALNLRNNTAAGSGTIVVNPTATLQLQGGNVAVSNAITLAGGTLESVSGNYNQFAGNINMTANSTITSSTAGHLLYVGNFVPPAPGTTSFNLNNNTLTVNGAGDTAFVAALGSVGDAGNLVSNSTGTVTFFGYENNYTGTTTINRGTLVIDTDPNSAYNNKTIRGNLIIGNGTDTATVIYSAGTGNNRIADTSVVTVNAGSTFNLNSKFDTIGNLALTNATVAIGADGNLLLKGGTGSVTVNGGLSTIIGRQFSLTDDNSVRDFDIASGATLQIDAQVTTGGISKSGTGTMILTGNNIYTGTTTVNAGVLNVRSNTGLGSNIGGTTVESGAVLQLEKASGLTISNETLTLKGTGISGTGALRNISGNNEWTGGTITIGSSSARINADSGTELKISSGVVLNRNNVTFGGAGNNFVTGVISDGSGVGAGTVTKDGTGTLTLTGDNNFSGVTTVNAGVLNIRHSYALGTSEGATTVEDGAALQIQRDSNYNNDEAIQVTGEALTLKGTGISNTGALRNITGDNSWGGTVTVNSATSRINSDSGTLTFSNTVAIGSNTLNVGGSGNVAISNTGALTGTRQNTGSGNTMVGALTKDGSGTLTLSGSGANFSGDVNIRDNGGTLAFGADDVFDNSSIDVYIGQNSQMSLVEYAQSIGTLAGLGTVNFGTSGSLTLLSNTTFAGSFTGTGTLRIADGVSFTLGANFNASGVTIELGVGSTLNLGGYTSTFAGLNVTGNSTISFTGNSTVSFTNLDVSAGQTLSVINWTDTQDYFLWTGNNSNATRGEYPLNQISFGGSSLPPPATQWNTSHTTWQPWDNQVTPVPEPSTYGAMLMAAGLAFFGYRRFRAQRPAKK